MPRYIVQVHGKKFGDVIANPGDDVTDYLTSFPSESIVRTLVNIGWLQVLPDPPASPVAVPAVTQAVPATVPAAEPAPAPVAVADEPQKPGRPGRPKGSGGRFVRAASASDPVAVVAPTTASTEAPEDGRA